MKVFFLRDLKVANAIIRLLLMADTTTTPEPAHSSCLGFRSIAEVHGSERRTPSMYRPLAPMKVTCVDLNYVVILFVRRQAIIRARSRLRLQ